MPIAVSMNCRVFRVSETVNEGKPVPLWPVPYDVAGHGGLTQQPQ